MSLAYRTTESGLVCAEAGMDGAAIDRALKRRDERLSLQGWFSETHGCVMWKVVCAVGGDRPPVTVCVWQSDRGEPYPLSSGLLDLVDRLDPNTRSEYVNEDELEQRRRRELARQLERDNEALRSDHLSVAGPGHSGLLHRGVHLRMARDRRRARGENV